MNMPADAAVSIPPSPPDIFVTLHHITLLTSFLPLSLFLPSSPFYLHQPHYHPTPHTSADAPAATLYTENVAEDVQSEGLGNVSWGK